MGGGGFADGPQRIKLIGQLGIAELFVELGIAHTVVGSDYRVSVRFASGGYTYRIYSNSGQGTAGVQVSDSKGNVVSNAKCIERPYMFPSYLQRALACDEETPYGAAACADKPLHLPK